jgi:UDP-glucose 4-epimerase
MYGVSKVAAENIISFYNHLYPVILRLGATVGPNLTHGIIYDFIRKLQGPDEFLEVLGDEPGSSKPFLHISDLDVPMELAINGVLGGAWNVYNVCNSDQASVKDIAEAVKSVTGINKEVKWLGSGANWKGDNNVLRADIELMSFLNGWSPKLTSIEAIKRTVKENL